MSAPPPPPRKKKNLDQSQEQPSGSAYNAVRRMSDRTDRNVPLSVNILEETPETTIGAGVKINGDFHFNTLLRIEGRFEGKLTSQGNLIIADGGVLIGNIENMGTVLIIDGSVKGNISVDRLVVQGESVVHGNISCKSLMIDPEVVVVGTLNVHKRAPENINFEGEIVNDVPVAVDAAGVSESPSDAALMEMHHSTSEASVKSNKSNKSNASAASKSSAKSSASDGKKSNSELPENVSAKSEGIALSEEPWQGEGEQSGEVEKKENVAADAEEEPDYGDTGYNEGEGLAAENTPDVQDTGDAGDTGDGDAAGDGGASGDDYEADDAEAEGGDAAGGDIPGQ